MAHFSSDHFSGTVRATKDVLKHGPLDVRRLNTLPTNEFGRNGDLVIVDNTATESPRVAENRIPTTVSLCQKVPFPVTPGTFTITTTAGVFPITIVTIDDVVEQIRLANIPGLTIELGPRGGILVHSVPATWADGTSNLPSETGVAGAQVGNYPIATGEWKCFPVGSFGAQSYGSISGGDGGTTVAVLASEIITFAGTGINVIAVDSGVPGSDSIAFTLDVADLPAFTGTVLPTDEIAIDNSGTTERVTVAKFLEDVDIPVIPGTGIVIKTGSGPDTWATRTITASAVAGDEGISVVDGDGVSGDPTIGVDITGQAAAGADMSPTDEFLGFDGTNNVKFTGQEIADGAAAIIGGASLTIINGEPVPTFIDTTRANKVLSIETACVPWARNKINNDDYLKANGDANDADAGWVCPHTATLVKATGVTANDAGNTKDINLYVNGALDTASILSFSPTATGQNTDRDVTLNIDVAQDDVIHLRGSAAGGEIQDVAVTLFFKWRG
jgi:hypothetical protein